MLKNFFEKGGMSQGMIGLLIFGLVALVIILAIQMTATKSVAGGMPSFLP